jgi:NADH-quinone oxidoreductase subunit D
MHGVIRIIARLDGERIEKVEDIEIGYLHRAFEKSCEQVCWNMAFPYTDRLNYVSPLINNCGYAMAVEKLLDLTVPERCEYIRVIMSELSRITDHLTCIAASAMELGAFTPFIYFMKAREYLYELIEEVTGARLTISYVRVGGVKADLPDDFLEKVPPALDKTLEVVEEVGRLLTRNRIFIDRMKDVGAIDKETAISYGFTGPLLRACGVGFDVRRATPYHVYDRIHFDIPVGEAGDNYDRYLVRMEEMRQSARIIRQALADIPGGPVAVTPTGKPMSGAEMVDLGERGQTAGLRLHRAVTDPTLEGTEKARRKGIKADDVGVSLPSKEDTYGNIEGLMNHFMLIMEQEGVQPPPGEAYAAVEGGNGELGFYVISDGSGKPMRVRCRPPCFPLMAGLGEMLEGGLMADVIATFGTVNMIAGELDR